MAKTQARESPRPVTPILHFTLTIKCWAMQQFLQVFTVSVMAFQRHISICPSSSVHKSLTKFCIFTISAVSVRALPLNHLQFPVYFHPWPASFYFFATLTIFAVLLRAFLSLICISPPTLGKLKEATKNPAPFSCLIGVTFLEDPCTLMAKMQKKMCGFQYNGCHER